MKYTKYIINLKINVNSIISNKWYLKHLSIIIGILVSIFGIIILTGVLLTAIAYDNGRYIKLKYYHLIKAYNKHQYINNVLNSLSVDMKDRRQLYLLLNGE